MQLKKYEIKTYVSKDIYQRVTQEALARRSTRAKIVRDGLCEYFLLREEMASAVESPGQLGESHTGKVIHTLLARTEERIALMFNALQTKLNTLHTDSHTLNTMIDQLYLDLMYYLPKLPNELVNQAIAVAKNRHEQWHKRIEQLASSREHSLSTG